MLPIIEKLLQRTIKDRKGCLVYNRVKHRPYVYYQGRRVVMARVIYMICTGKDIPEKYYICHSCDNPLCINPEHLFLGTPLENARDRDLKNRGAKGSRSGHAKLTEQIVLAIRLYSRKKQNIHAVAKDFGLPYSIVYDVIKGNTWKHVAGG